MPMSHEPPTDTYWTWNWVCIECGQVFRKAPNVIPPCARSLGCKLQSTLMTETREVRG